MLIGRQSNNYDDMELGGGLLRPILTLYSNELNRDFLFFLYGTFYA